jgi:hypothetical protein
MPLLNISSLFSLNTFYSRKFYNLRRRQLIDLLTAIRAE